MKKIIVLLTLFVIGCAPVLPTITPTPELPQSIDGVNVYYGENKFFPDKNCYSRKLSNEDAWLAVKIVQEFLSFYSPELIESYLWNIYLASSLRCDGITYGGTYKIPATIYVDGASSGKYLLNLLHAEFSSILLYSQYYEFFPFDEWEAVNPPDFEYTERATEILAGEDKILSNEEINEAGFITSYSMTNLENDFNTLVGYMIASPDYICGLRQTYPRIEEKAQLVIEFYSMVDQSVRFQECEEGE